MNSSLHPLLHQSLLPVRSLHHLKVLVVAIVHQINYLRDGLAADDKVEASFQLLA